MNRRSILKLPARRLIILMIATWLFSGCGGGDDFGENVPMPQVKSAAGTFAPGKSLSFPADRPFNVTDAQRQSKGIAKTSSAAEPTGLASCEVDASAGGSGTAEFQIGQVLTNDAKSAVNVTVTFDIAYECVLKNCTPRSGPMPLALKAYVMDSQRRTLAKVMIAEADPERLPNRWSGSVSPSFDVTFEPETAYHLVVAGRVEALAEEPPGPLASLRVKSLAITVAPASP